MFTPQKTPFLTIRVAGLFLSLSLLLAGCKEEEVTEPSYAALNPSEIDRTGGTWKQVIVTHPTDIMLPAPEAASSEAYRQEVQALKSSVSQRTSEQQAAVRYWASGGVMRWNEIARKLVIKYNVAPVAQADGTFPAFDPTNPFTNPPFAARVYALISVAQYDALVSAWHYKYAYGRMAPKKMDASLSTLVPDTDLPSYPSEDAVVAAASLSVLKFLFPRDSVYLKSLAEQHVNSRLWAGANVGSDLAAGDAVGKAVAAKVIAYAKTDKMGAARDPNNTYVDPQYTAPSWKSLEVPSRPPMLPLYGKVNTWFDRMALTATLPGPPPKVGTPEFQKALAEVRKISQSRTREQWRIADFWADGAGTATPPGHWNQIAAEMIRKNNLNELRSARVLALLNRAVMDAGICCWETKYQYFTPRPSQVDPTIKTSTGLPNFPSYTSGHATFSGSAAVVLGYLFPSESAVLNAWAEEAAVSRLYGGIHYRFDNDAGLSCGKGVGQVAVNWAKGDGAPQ
jgi:membrane-associated phospholipid phosphatase